MDAVHHDGFPCLKVSTVPLDAARLGGFSSLMVNADPRDRLPSLAEHHDRLPKSSRDEAEILGVPIGADLAKTMDFDTSPKLPDGLTIQSSDVGDGRAESSEGLFVPSLCFADRALLRRFGTMIGDIGIDVGT